MGDADELPPPWGSLTDVPGFRVGHAQRVGAGWLTGVTVVLPPLGTIGSVDVRGGGPGTHETDALDPSTLVPTVDAVTLTGGSAFGLASALGVQEWCVEAGRGFAAGPPDDPRSILVPIVPAAAIFDLGRGGDPAKRPGPAEGYEAARAASATTPTPAATNTGATNTDAAATNADATNNAAARNTGTTMNTVTFNATNTTNTAAATGTDATDTGAAITDASTTTHSAGNASAATHSAGNASTATHSAGNASTATHSAGNASAGTTRAGAGATGAGASTATQVVGGAGTAAGRGGLRGSVGAGTGAYLAHQTLKGGVGSASVRLPGGIVVGALAVANAAGSPVDPVTGALYGTAFVPPGLPRPPVTEAPGANTRRPGRDGLNTTLAVVATNAALDIAQVKRMATAAHDGIARAISPAHTLVDGDTVFALASGEIPVDGLPTVVAVHAAAADALLLAILDAVLSAEALPGTPPPYRP